MKRIALIFIGATLVLLLGLLLLLGTSAYWLPWAAPRLLGIAEIEVDSASRGEKGDLVLRGIHYQNPSMEVGLAELRTPMPLPWLWHGLRRRPEKAGEIRLEDLSVQLWESPPAEKSDDPAPGPEAVFHNVHKGLELAERWLPPVWLEKFTLSIQEESEPFIVSATSFRGGVFELSTAPRGDLPDLQLHAELPANRQWNLKTEVDDWNLTLQADFEANSENPQLKGKIVREKGEGAFLVEWKSEKWLPTTTALNVESLEIPKGIEALPPDLDPLIIESLQLDWDGSGYDLKTSMRAGVAKEKLTVDLSLEGDLKQLELQTFQVNGSWVHLNLGEPARVNLETLQSEAPFEFVASADLSGQNYYPATGKILGSLEANFVPGGNSPLHFSMGGEDLAADGHLLGSVDVVGSLEFPVVRIESLRATLPKGSMAEIMGTANLEEKVLSFEANANLQADDLEALAGIETGIEGPVRFEGEVAGPWTQLQHEGTLQVGQFTQPSLKPLDLSVDWEGVGADRIIAHLKVAAEDEDVELLTAWERTGQVLSGQLHTLTWRQKRETFLELQNPAEIRLDLGKVDQLPWKGLEVGQILLSGEERKLGLLWHPPMKGTVEISGLYASDLSGWLSPETVLPVVSVDTVSLQVEEFEPVLVGSAVVKAGWRDNPQSSLVSARLQARLDKSGINLEELDASYGNTPLVEGKLTVPIVLNPWALTHPEPSAEDDRSAEDSSAARDGSKKSEPFLRVLSSGEMSGSIAGKWSPELQELIQEWGGPRLEGGEIELKVAGSVEKPQVHLSLDLDSIDLEKEWVGDDFPQVRKLGLELVINEEKILLNQGVLELRDSGIGINAELPFPVVLEELQKEENLDALKILSSTRADVKLKNWDASVWKDRLPILFRPQGKITGTVGIDPGLKMRGEVDITGFAIRPTLYSSPVDDIHATLEFEGRQVVLKDAGASFGGGGVTTSGTVHFDEWMDPWFEFKISGENVPVARTTDMIIRTDLDLTLAQQKDERTPLLKGDLNLRNSTFLINIDPFSPNIESGPGNSPPYFSVDADPFSKWRLNLTIEGQDFLRVRSSIFSTELSAALRLTRTLGDPLLLGSVRATSGSVRFPGISMRIESFEAFITPDEPNLLQLEADAVGQNRRYVVGMNVSGSSDSPQIQFTSTPTLSNAQIVRLLATGSLDGGGAGAIGLYLGQVLLGPGSGEDTLADRFSVEIGQEVTENGRSTVDVTYRINDLWSIEGEYDRYDTYNLNLVRILLER